MTEKEFELLKQKIDGLAMLTLKSVYGEHAAAFAKTAKDLTSAYLGLEELKKKIDIV